MSIDLLPGEKQQNKSPESVVSPEVEAMRDAIAGIAKVAEARTTTSTGRHNQLIRKAESRNPLTRRPSDEALSEVVEESGRDIFALAVAVRMKDIIDAAPKDSETGFSLSIAESSGKKEEDVVVKRLEVGKIDEGILFNVVKDGAREGDKNVVKTFILSNGGYLFEVWYDKNGNRKTSPMRGYLEEKRAKWRLNEGEKNSYLHNAEGPSERLNEDIELFYQAATREIGGDRYATSTFPVGVEMKPLEETLKMPQTKPESTSKYLI